MRTIYCIILLLSFIKVDGTNLDSLFAQANNLYANEQYDSSIVFYDSILKLGYESENIYYNLGNCYYFKGNIPNSILYFEKSLVINPKSSEAKSNLEITHKRISYLEELPQLFIYKWWNNFTDIFSLKTWTIVVLVFLWFSCFAIYLFYTNKKKRLFNTIVVLVIASSVFASALNSKINSIQKVYGILSEKSAIYQQANTNIQMSEVDKGNKALILLEKDEWIFIRFSNGLQGWIKMESLLII